MSLSLYDAVIPAMLQMLGAAQNWIDKAEGSELSEEQIASACLIEDMLPLAYQVKSMSFHSMGAIKGLHAGVFSPDFTEPATSFEGMRACLKEASDFLKALDPAEINGFMGKDMRFEFKDHKIPFTAEGFLTSFSVPNFFFHTTTFYSILRAKGVDVGKLDYLGQMQIKEG